MLGAVVLGAGLSRRMGSEKLLLPIGGKKILEKTVEAVAEGFKDVIVIVTRKAILDGIEMQRAPVYLINDRPELGQATSLKIAVAYLDTHYPECQGVLVFLGDQPLISQRLVEEIVRVVTKNPESIVMPEYQGRRGHPIAFGKRWFKALLAVSGDTGGRQIIEAHPEALIKIPGDRTCVMDADTPEDYRRLLEYYEGEWSEYENL
ncbi:nucleotidyltransferase family protein [Eubacterium sp. 1001713B170207_170306_E7]|uniref:nucleotidyltransferase family protein n=1 Tax=Eubacterium sp. 1001713B170207_170306_E7 TaxID=2787097 RepID=UPI00189AD03E|nr:nucleotidyltransferase family protein [Eubacterium sp. 1001713B170207_170306_E7]